MRISDKIPGNHVRFMSGINARSEIPELAVRGRKIPGAWWPVNLKSINEHQVQ